MPRVGSALHTAIKRDTAAAVVLIRTYGHTISDTYSLQQTCVTQYPTHIACSKQSLLRSCSRAANVVVRGSVAGPRDARRVGSVVAKDGGQEESGW